MAIGTRQIFLIVSKSARVASKFAFMAESKLASAPEDITPWKTCAISTSLLKTQLDSVHKSAFMFCAWLGVQAFEGTGGSMISVSMNECALCSSSTSFCATSWPIKLVAPVMNIRIVYAKRME
jgi:hypothetical protein